jgi:putative DNA primase/helicase
MAAELNCEDSTHTYTHQANRKFSAPRFKQIPQELRRSARWVLWRSEQRDGKPTKVPYQPDGTRARANDPATWHDFNTCLGALANNDYAGLGFVLGDGWAGVDLDGCRDPDTGQVQAEAQQIIEQLRSYTEVSVSGQGIHIICRGTLPPGRRRQGRVELYDANRFFVVTGERVNDYPIRDCTKELAELHQQLFGATQGTAPPPSAHSTARGNGQTAWDAQALLDLARAKFKPPQLAKFHRLWRGEWQGLYPSQSEADLALARMLKILLPESDESEIASYIGLSALGQRDKWRERADYRERTVRVVVSEPPTEARLPDTFLKPPLTDLGNAERLVALFGQDLAWTEAWGWLVWDGQRWAIDNQRRIEELAVATVRAMYRGAAQLDDPDRRKALASWAQRSESRSRVEAMIALARHMVARKAEEFDRDPWLLNCANGTLDLRTGRLLPRRREDLVTKLVPVNYDPQARCPRWEQFLREVFAPHSDLIPFIQRAAGYSLTGDTREECLFLLHGTGRNGKGTLLRTLTTLLADYALTADFATFLAGPRDRGPRDDVANMRGRRLVVSQEVREGAPLAESLIKWLTGGDRIRARNLYERSVEWLPTHKIWLAVNHKPIIRGTDDAIWSRIKLVPFDVSFAGREDRQLKSKLEEELEGILTWAVEGCRQWLASGLQCPATVHQATQQYRVESDQIGRFIEECCVTTDGGRVRARPLYQAYRAWCEQTGEHPITETAFAMRLAERGLRKARTSRHTFYVGIQLREEL